jgi:serine protease Do
MVDEPQPNSPAAAAGVKAGDVITAINDNPVKDARDLARKVASVAPGTSVKFDLLRDGNAKTLNLTVAKMPDQQQQQATAAPQQGESEKGLYLGLELAPASKVAGAGDSGVVVMGVDPDGPAAEHGVQTGDVILRIGASGVSNSTDIRSALREAKKEGKRDVLMQIKSAGTTRFVAIPIG